MSAPEKPLMRQRLVPETWKDAHDSLWSELLEEPESNLPIDKEISRYHDLSALLMCDITGLRAAHLRMTANGNETRQMKKLDKVIVRLDETMKNSHLGDTYFSGRIDRAITPAEDISHQIQMINRELYSAIGEAESWLIILDMVPSRHPDIGRRIQLNIERRLEEAARRNEVEEQATRSRPGSRGQEGTGEEVKGSSESPEEPEEAS